MIGKRYTWIKSVYVNFNLPAVTLHVEGVEEGDGLNGFTQTHLVGQNDVDVVVPGVSGPGYTLQL